MPFMFNGQYIRAQFRYDLNHQPTTNLYGLIAAADPNGVFTKLRGWLTDYVRNGKQHAIHAGGTKFLSVLELFDQVIYEPDDDFDDDTILGELYALGGGTVIALNQITGCGTAAAFLQQLNAAIDESSGIFQSGLPTLADTSFPATYDYKDITRLLWATGVTRNNQLVVNRLFETAYIMNRIINKGRCIAASLMLAEMHNQRFRTYKDPIANKHYYNQGSVLYTLLTFSYLVANGVGGLTAPQLARWYYFWKMFGSLLGIPWQLLPNNHAQSQQLWNDFINSDLCAPADMQATMLSNVYNNALAQQNQRIGNLAQWQLPRSWGQLTTEVRNKVDGVQALLGAAVFVTSMKGKHLTQQLFWKVPGLPTLWKFAQYSIKHRII